MDAEETLQMRQALEEEQWLMRRARDYSELQRKKAVKWFVSHGAPLPSDDDVRQIYAQREQAIAARAAHTRAEDRARVVVERAVGVAVPAAAHPLYQDNPEVPHFGAGAANGMAGRQTLQRTFSNLVWTIMLRARAEQRLARAAQQLQRGQAATQAGAGTVAISRRSTTSHGAGAGAPQVLAMLRMPAFLPHLEAPAAYATAEAPSTTQVERFTKKALKVPFEFQLKAYKPCALPEHHFASADPPEVVPVLPAGAAEVPEEAPGGGPPGSQVPRIEHFTQPLITLETFPMRSFPFAHTNPSEGRVIGTALQPDSDGGFAPPYHTVDFGHFVPSALRVFDIYEATVVREPLPRHLKGPAPEDELSDSDDDADLPALHPKDLDEIAAWLPPFRNAASASSFAGVAGSSSGSGGSGGSGGGTAPNVTATATSPAGSSSPSVGARAADLLARDEKHVHRIGIETINRPAQQRMAASREWIASFVAQLPLPMQLQF